MKYRAITHENFYLQEMKQACRFLLSHPDIENPKEVFRSEDILECQSLSNFNKKYSTICKRMEALSPRLQELFVELDHASAAIINFYAILWNERLFAEFMDEVIREHYQSYNFHLREQDFTTFMEAKKEQSEIVAGWSVAGTKKMLSKIKIFVTAAGYLKKDGELYEIQKPVIHPDILEEIEATGETALLRIMLY